MEKEARRLRVSVVLWRRFQYECATPFSMSSSSTLPSSSSSSSSSSSASASAASPSSSYSSLCGMARNLNIQLSTIVPLRDDLMHDRETLHRWVMLAFELAMLKSRSGSTRVVQG